MPDLDVDGDTSGDSEDKEFGQNTVPRQDRRALQNWEGDGLPTGDMLADEEGHPSGTTTCPQEDRLVRYAPEPDLSADCNALSIVERPGRHTGQLSATSADTRKLIPTARKRGDTVMRLRR